MQIVRTRNADPVKWEVAGFGDDQTFRIVEINDPNHALVKEIGTDVSVNNSQLANNGRVMEIFADTLDRTPRRASQPMEWLMREAITLIHGERHLKQEISAWLEEHANPMETIWNHYHKNEFQRAIDRASEFVRSRENIARSQAQRVQASKRTKLDRPKGQVSTLQRHIILADSELNDVATCHIIIGLSAKNLNLNKTAREAFERVQSFPEARTWDPRGWFWAPIDKAVEELKVLP